MPRRSLTLRVAAALAAVTLGASLAACSDTTRIPPAPTDTDAAEPLFASDEEALAAAVEAYEEYLEASRVATESGGVLIERLEEVTTPEQFAVEQETLALYRDGGLRTEGTSELRNPALQQWFPTESGANVVLYGCLDISALAVFDVDGELVDDSGRQELLPLEITTVHRSAGQTGLVASSEVWNGASTC